MTIREVIWRDSRLYIHQEPITEPWSYETIHSVGYIVSEDDEQIVLTGDLIDKDVRRTIVIPKENIISIRKLK
jgi:predicted membrane protein